MTARDERSSLSGPHPFRHEKHPDNQKAGRTDHNDTETRHGSGEAFTTKPARPTYPDEDRGEDRNRARGQVDT